jgi:hypothetical protein
MPRACWLFMALLPMTGGCLTSFGSLEKSTISLVPSQTVNTPVTTSTSAKVSYAPGSADTAVLVDAVGHKILAANPDAQIKPFFATIGATQTEIFHKGDQMLYITEGLVKKCKSEGQLAALLSEELAAMEAERRTLARGRLREVDRQVPISVPVGNAGQFNTPDLTHLAELSRVEKSRAPGAKRSEPIDLHELARNFLHNAQFTDADYESARPLLREAEGNWSLEKSINGSAALSSH